MDDHGGDENSNSKVESMTFNAEEIQAIVDMLESYAGDFVPVGVDNDEFIRKWSILSGYTESYLEGQC